MADSQRWIQRHWRRLQWGQFLGQCGDHLAMALIAWGSVVLLVKLLAPGLWPYPLWLAAGLLVVPYVSWLKVRNNSFTQAEATALLDQKLQAGGLLMTLSEAPDEMWREHLPQIEQLWHNSLPKMRPKRFASLVSVPLAFAVASCFIPVREASLLQATPRPVAQQETNELEAILKTLEEADILDEEDKAKLKQEIEKFAEETHDQPLTSEQWETADSLRQQMQMQWEKNERSVQAANQAVEQLMSQLANQGELSADQIEQLEEALGENLQNLAKQAMQGNTEQMPEGLKKALENLAKSGEMSLPKDAAERQQMLQDLKDKLQKESERLAKQRGECEGLCQSQGDCGNGQCDNPGNRPGKGGVNRGRGDAPMMWGDESDLAGTKFKEVVLPPGVLDDPSEEILGLTFSEPDVEPAESAPRAGLRDSDPSAGRATWDRKLNPRHRDVVRKFFQSQRQSQPIPEDAEL